MSRESLKEFIEIFKISREYVKSFTLTYASYFEKPITIESLKEFCNSVQVNLKKSPFGWQVPGRLESRVENDKQTVNVFYDAGLDSIPKFNAIMHEIGHWFLLKEGNGLSQKDLRWRELFANNFSSLACIPFYNRYNVVKSLFSAKSVTDIREIVTSNGIKLNVSNLLRILNFEIRNDSEYLPLLNTSQIWIAIKLMPKKGSLIEPKFRILSSLYDFTRFYVPDQTRVGDLIADITNRLDINIGDTARFDSNIKLFSIDNTHTELNQEMHNRFVSRIFPCTIQILRLRRSIVDNLTTYLLHIQVSI